MAFWNIIGGTANTSFGSDGFATGTDVDAGSVRFAGTVASARFQTVNIGEGNPVITLASGVDYIDPANGTLPVSSWNAGDQVIVKVTSDIAGAANNTLLFGASDSANKYQNNQAAVVEVKLYKTAIRNGDWNPTTAPWGGTPVSVAQSGAWNVSAGVDNSTTLIASGTDDAANPTQDVPGELVYHYGSGSDPTTDQYEARNLW
jgi:hypothetical protein